jgi:hypothetical protein
MLQFLKRLMSSVKPSESGELLPDARVLLSENYGYKGNTGIEKFVQPRLYRHRIGSDRCKFSEHFEKILHGLIEELYLQT